MVRIAFSGARGRRVICSPYGLERRGPPNHVVYIYKVGQTMRAALSPVSDDQPIRAQRFEIQKQSGAFYTRTDRNLGNVIEATVVD
jgi:hypothetical protein